MDVLRKFLLIIFYVAIVAVGIGGFFALRSVRDQPLPTETPAHPTQLSPVADSLERQEVVQ